MAEETDEILKLLSSGDDPLSSAKSSPDPEIKPEIKTQAIMPVVEPITEPFKDEKPPSEILETVKQDDDTEGIKKLIVNFGEVAENIIQNYKVDRNQVEEAINYFQQQVKEARNKKERLPPSLIDGWVKLLSVKAEINTNATGLTDSIAKLLAAAKNNNIIINNTVNKGGSSIDLASILSQPLKEDENDA